MLQAGLRCGPGSPRPESPLGGPNLPWEAPFTSVSEARAAEGYPALRLTLSLPSGCPWLLARCPWGPRNLGVLGPPVGRSPGPGWPATAFNNSNRESKRFHPSCLWAEEERKEEGAEGVEGAG